MAFRVNDKRIDMTQLNQKMRQGRGTGSAVSLSSVGVLLMVIVPWLVYDKGAGAAWIAIGFFVGTLLLWLAYSYRLLRFSLLQKERFTLSGFFSARYREEKPVIRSVMSVCLTLFFLFVAATLLYGIAEFAEALFGSDRIYIVIGITLISTGLFFVLGRGGLCLAERWIAALVLFALVALNLSIYRILGIERILENIFHSWAAGSVSEYVNVGYLGGESLSVFGMLSLFSYGFLVLGNPLALSRFQRSDRARTIHRSRRWAVIFSILTLFLSVLTGGMLRAALYPANIKTVKELYLWIMKEDADRGFLFHLAGLIFVAAAFLLVLDLLHNCLLNATETVYEDLYPVIARRRRKDKNTERKAVSLILVFAEIIVCILALEGGNYLYTVSLDAMVILAAGLAPAMMLSLHSSRTTAVGCIAAFLGGMAFAACWMFGKWIPLDKVSDTWQTMQEFTGFAAVLPGMIFGLIAGKIGSAASEKPSEQIGEDFENVRYRLVSGVHTD